MIPALLQSISKNESTLSKDSFSEKQDLINNESKKVCINVCNNNNFNV